MMKFQVLSGESYPLGATFDGQGVNFALFSANAEKVELCLFNETGTKETDRILLTNNDCNIWHIYLKGAQAGLVYGYRVYGPYEPQKGKRFNPHKLLLDPYAKKIIGRLIWHKALFAYDVDSSEKDLSFSKLDSAPYMPKSVVVEDTFDWDKDKHPQVSFDKTVIYETHIRGITKLNSNVESRHRGKFLGMAADSVLNYLDWLGVTAVELLPVFSFFGDKDGMYTDNYWGYETLSYFTPEAKYMVNNDINEFKQMVKSLHAHGKEVILDAVYNHTIEGNHLGPTLCYRGIDNESYYVLAEDKRFYYDCTGCGALFNLENPYVLGLVMDSMRYWVREMHVDGFRLDLASALSRRNNKFVQDSGFLYAVRQDDTLRQVKMIAEPWDASMDGYRIGAFPPNWGEWNDRYRDVVRRFWRGDNNQIGEFASRIAGSSDIFGYHNRGICSSINFLTSHDGFNLNDLVSYNEKHNIVNGENNRDGNDSNWSWNSGEEGETLNEDVRKNRMLRKKAMLATLFLSFGTPMIVSGDEFGNTQFGNNNPYCQDNVLTWLAWDAVDAEDKKLARYVRELIALRRNLKIFNRSRFFTGTAYKYAGKMVKDIIWLTESGKEFTTAEWVDEKRKMISCLIFNGLHPYWFIFNSNAETKEWQVPDFLQKAEISVIFDSSGNLPVNLKVPAKNSFSVPAWSVVVMEVNQPEK